MCILEFTRASDASDDWQEKKEVEKNLRYCQHVKFISELTSWHVQQINFTLFEVFHRARRFVTRWRRRRRRRQVEVEWWRWTRRRRRRRSGAMACSGHAH